MRRIVSVWLPHLPIERILRSEPGAIDDSAPWALIGSEARGQVITAVNARAHRDGIRAGMALADARAMLPGLRSRPAEPGRDAALLSGLARWCGRYGPARNTEGSDGLWIDITGVAHLFARPAAPLSAPPATVSAPGSPEDREAAAERALLSDLTRRLRGLGLTVRTGLADTIGAAHALARYASTASGLAVSPPGETRAALAALPVGALRLAPASCLLLTRLGLTRIGDLYGLPRAALERRFRDAEIAARVLTRLDQALGLCAEPGKALAEPPPLSVRRVYAEPLIVSASIEAEVRTLAEELSASLEASGQGLRRLVLSLYRTDASLATIGAGTSSPCRAPAHMVDLLSLKLAAVDAGFGIDALVLDAVETERLDATQTGLAATAAEASPAHLVDRLSNRIGASRVLRITARSSHVPERAATSLPALRARPPASRSRFSCSRGGTIAARPSFLLPHPEPIRVIAEIPEGAPVRFIWRRLSHAVIRAEGPERIEPEWWRSIAGSEARISAVRDYYRIEDATGGRYWIFRHGRYDAEDAEEESDPGWYMHGVFA